MKSLLLGLLFFFNAHADFSYIARDSQWSVRVIEDRSVSREDVPRMITQYPQHVALIDVKHFATAYAVGIRSETWTWIGSSVCSATDPRLTVGILRVSVAAYKDNGKTTYGISSASALDPNEADPCL